MIKKILALCSLPLALGAFCNQQVSSLDECYAIDNDPDQTIIRIIDKPGEGYVDTIIFSDSQGKNAQKSTGKIENGVFSFPTPGQYKFDDQKIVGEGELIGGITGTSTTCPNLDEYSYTPL